MCEEIFTKTELLSEVCTFVSGVAHTQEESVSLATISFLLKLGIYDWNRLARFSIS